MSEITKPTLLNETFAEKMDAQADILKALAFMSIDSSKIATPKDLANVVSRGMGKEILNIGDYFEDAWKDGATSYDVQYDFMHIGDVAVKSGKNVPGLFCQWHYATPFGVQFSHQRAFYVADENGLAAGTYYFTIDADWGNNVHKGDVVCFTLANAVPAGGKLAGCYGVQDQTKDKWKVYVFDADGLNQLEEVATTNTASGTSLGTMKMTDRNGDLNSLQEMAYGYNRYSFSALRQWLNSNKTAGNWWKAQDKWDIRPDQLATKDGFLKGVSSELIAAMIPTRVRTALNTNVDKAVGEYEDVYDKVFLPSNEQMYIVPQANGIEGETWDYYKSLSGKATPTPWYKTYEEGGQAPFYGIDNKSAAQTVRLRGAARGSANNAWCVNTSGYVNNYLTSHAYRVVPACVIGKI